MTHTICNAGADAILINLNEEYGGELGELREASNACHSYRDKKAVACIAKDIIIHPIQVRLD
jgi:hypothetical protein